MANETYPGGTWDAKASYAVNMRARRDPKTCTHERLDPDTIELVCLSCKAYGPAIGGDK